MIVASLRQIAPETGHDHEPNPWDEPGGGAYVMGGADEVGAACGAGTACGVRAGGGLGGRPAVGGLFTGAVRVSRRLGDKIATEIVQYPNRTFHAESDARESVHAAD